MSANRISVGLLIALLLCSYTPAVKKNLNVVFIGDSITYGVLLKKAPPLYAQDHLREEPETGSVAVSNQGVSGYTTVNFLPATGTVFPKAEAAATRLQAERTGQLIFSIMLGTNDSAEDGPLGSPVSPRAYRANMQTIIARLLKDFPRSRVVVNYPIWYSPNTYNGARYLQQGLSRLQHYFPEIDTLLSAFQASDPGRVYGGSKKAFKDFKKHYLADYTPQKGHQGTFYLHPNAAGADKLGTYWASAIYQASRD